VSRALARVTEFFRNRGFALPSAGAATLLGQATQAAQAVPAGLASSAAAAGLAQNSTKPVAFDHRLQPQRSGGR
jgi:hypothetical protein